MADSVEQLCTQKRTDILSFAKRLADDGAHYLWGANGEKPAANGTVSYAPVVLDTDKLQVTCFCAAIINYGAVQYVCAGRFRHADLRGAQPAQKIAMPKVGLIQILQNNCRHLSKRMKTIHRLRSAGDSI
jgi:hypothetical protein